jgi:hypothetical protein
LRVLSIKRGKTAIWLENKYQGCVSRRILSILRNKQAKKKYWKFMAEVERITPHFPPVGVLVGV